MLMNKWKIFSISIIILAVSILPIYYLFPDTHPMGGMIYEISPDLLKVRSLEIAGQLGVNPEDYNVNTHFRKNNHLVEYVQEQHGLARGNELLRLEYPGYYWEIEVVHLEAHSDLLESPTGLPPGIHKFEHINLRFDSRGNLFGLDTEIPDSLVLEQPTLSEASEIATDLIKTYTNYKSIKGDRRVEDSLVVSSQIISNPGEHGYIESHNQRKDYDFTFSTTMNHIDSEIEIKVSLKGDLISKMEIVYFDAPAEENQFDTLRGILNIVLLISISESKF